MRQSLPPGGKVDKPEAWPDEGKIPLPVLYAFPLRSLPDNGGVRRNSGGSKGDLPSASARPFTNRALSLPENREYSSFVFADLEKYTLFCPDLSILPGKIIVYRIRQILVP